MKTKRLLLKRPQECLAETVLEYLIRNRLFFEPWLPARTEDFYTLERQKSELDRKTKCFAAETEFRFYIFKHTDLTTIIGEFGFSNIVKGVFLSAHLGYQTDHNEINNGYMTEALEEGIKYFFQEKKYHRIEANVIPRNKPSIRLLEKLDFVNEGISKKYLKINNCWEDHIRYVRLNERIE